ncbi:MAG TPA: carbohydrate-binding protein, partial [Humisphaera sp.]|nr:carbohydrate-binding protein [Humisphaera sp.]
IKDPKLSQPAGSWVGAIVHITPGQAWDGQTGVVTASSPGSITISYQYHSIYANLAKGETFFLTGKMVGLTAPGDWYRDPSSGKLYAWAPNGASPASQDIEVKHRLYAFNLSGDSNIDIKGVNIFASTIMTTGSSSNVVINGITARYVSCNVVATQGWLSTTQDGIILAGSGDIIENSTIQYSAGAALVLKGVGSQSLNNVVSDAVYNATNSGSILVLGTNAKVDHNTITNSGRHGIAIVSTHVSITYNFVSNVGLQTTEAGGIYSAGQNAHGSVIAYNVVENIHTAGYGGTALFIDNYSDNWVIHNNITSNVDYGLKMNFTSNGNQIYNNTLGATKLSINTNQKGNWDGTSISNNVFLAGAVFTTGAKITGNVKSAAAGKGAGSVKAGASGVSVAAEPPPVTTPPVTTPPVTTPPATTPLATSTIQAVDYTSSLGVKGDNFGGVGYAYNNDWVSYALNFGSGVTKITADLAAIYSGGTIEVHSGSPTGTLLGTIKVAVTGAWNKYTSQSATISKIAGDQTVYLVLKGPTPGVANIDWLTFS